MIILSKDTGIFLDEQTKVIIKEMFGEDFSKIVDNYENRCFYFFKEIKNI